LKDAAIADSNDTVQGQL